MTRRILVLMAGVLLLGACSQKKTPPLPDNNANQPNVSTQPNNNVQNSYDYMKGKSEETEYF